MKDVPAAVPPEARVNLESPLRSNLDVFSVPDKNLDRTAVCEHNINIGDARPVRQPLRRQPLSYTAQINAQLDQILEVKPTMSKEAVSVVSSGMNLGGLLVYLDDVTICRKTCEQRLETVYKRLRAAILRFKPSQCSLLRRSVCFLGLIMSSQGITVRTRVRKEVSWVCEKVPGSHYVELILLVVHWFVPVKKRRPFPWDTNGECLNAITTARPRRIMRRPPRCRIKLSRIFV